MYRGFEQRRCIPLGLSVFVIFFFSASYWLWSGAERVRLVPSFQDADAPGAAENEVLTTPTPLPPASKELTADQIVLAEYDEAPIREMCKKSSWADSRNVVVNCEARVGGVGRLYPQSR